MLQGVQIEHSSFNKKTVRHQFKILNSRKKFYLDYKKPTYLHHNIPEEQRLKRERIFKNLVFQIVIEIRQEKQKMKISHLLDVIRV